MKKFILILMSSLLILSCTTFDNHGRVTERGWFSKWMVPVNVGDLRVGMTRDELNKMVRFPLRVNRSTTANGIREQWIYDGGQYGRDIYLYVENDVLVGWQEF